MIEVQVLIPTEDNNKVPFAATHHDVFERFVTARFPGLSLQPGTVSGRWVDAGTVYRDELRVYTVAVEGILKQSEPLREVVTFAKAHYGQIAIYVRYLNVSEIL